MARCENQQAPQDVTGGRTWGSESERPTGEQHDTLMLPAYAQMLGAYHRAFSGELRAMLGELPLACGHRVLDLACGDGSYARWMGRRIAPAGHVTAMDLSLEYLTLARHRACAGPKVSPISTVAGDVQRLPFADRTFDVAWCAQSLYSLPEPGRVLQEMRRVVRRGGIVAVLENDPLHHVVLPWPVGLELDVRRAEWHGSAGAETAPGKFEVGRRLYDLFRRAGLEQCRLRTYAASRQAPLGADEHAFIKAYVQDLRRRVHPHLGAAVLRQFDRLFDPNSAFYLPRRPDFSFTCLDQVIWGVRRW
jgi:SAM-dependent methyltransferase